MGAILERAGQLREALQTALDARDVAAEVLTSSRDVDLSPDRCVVIMRPPRVTYVTVLDGTTAADTTWRLVLAAPAGADDLTAWSALDDLLDALVDLLAVRTAEPGVVPVTGGARAGYELELEPELVTTPTTAQEA